MRFNMQEHVHGIISPELTAQTLPIALILHACYITWKAKYLFHKISQSTVVSCHLRKPSSSSTSSPWSSRFYCRTHSAGSTVFSPWLASQNPQLPAAWSDLGWKNARQCRYRWGLLGESYGGNSLTGGTRSQDKNKNISTQVLEFHQECPTHHLIFLFCYI